MSDETPGGRLFSRRRRANVTGGRHQFHKVKVTPEEEAVLLRLSKAQRVTMSRLLNTLDICVTRLASGLPVGGDLEYADEVTLGRAFEGRRVVTN